MKPKYLIDVLIVGGLIALLVYGHNWAFVIFAIPYVVWVMNRVKKNDPGYQAQLKKKGPRRSWFERIRSKNRSGTAQDDTTTHYDPSPDWGGLGGDDND